MFDNADHPTTSLPDQKNYDKSYGLALKMAAEQLAGLPDIEEQCRESGSDCRLEGGSRKIILKYLNQTYQVTLPEAAVTLQDNSGEVDLRDRILILHYLVHARGTPLSGKWIAYQELPEGAGYYPSFFKRAVKPLIDHFGAHPDRLPEAAGGLGGYRADFGDVSVTIPAFSRAPVTLALWRGDDEFPPNASILFDSTIPDYLPPEDINVLCQTIAWKLVKSAQNTPLR
ncbi:MAG: DUF3786 domain-containing protein [Dehalococcoidales bacterium]|nr:DUF3786 domain-containing protein [Dehalococcoidales bacterium]